MNRQDKFEDGQSNVVPLSVWTNTPEFKALRFPGGPVDTRGMRASHNGPTPTTVTRIAAPYPTEFYDKAFAKPRNVKLTRPAEQYPGEAERMIAEHLRLASVSIAKALDATSEPRLHAELEMAARMIQEAIRWSKP